MIAYLRRVFVERPLRDGWVETLVDRLTGAAIAALLVVTFCLMVSESPASALLGVAATVPLMYVVEWAWRWCRWMRQRRLSVAVPAAEFIGDGQPDYETPLTDVDVRREREPGA